MTKSRTQQALALVDGGLSIYAAAKKLGLSYSTLHKAVKTAQERESRGTCPTCGQIMPRRHKPV